MVAAAAARLLSRPDQIGAVFSTIPSRRPTKSKRAETMSIRGADRNKKQLHSQVIHNMIRTHTHTINDKWAGYITTGTTTATSATGLLGRETGRTSQENRHFFIFFFYILFLDFSCFFLLFSSFPGDEENITAKVFLALFLDLSQPNCPFTHPLYRKKTVDHLTRSIIITHSLHSQ